MGKPKTRADPRARQAHSNPTEEGSASYGHHTGRCVSAKKLGGTETSTTLPIHSLAGKTKITFRTQTTMRHTPLKLYFLKKKKIE